VALLKEGVYIICNNFRMKKSLFIFFALITFTNVSYASFPVADTLELKEDASQIEEIKQYHSNLVKMGIDLNDCKCESCRKSNGKDNTIQQSGARGLYILSGLILLGVIIWMSIGLTRAYNCVDTGDCPQSSREGPKSGAPVELGWMSLLILISIGVAIRARFIQLRNRRNSLENN
jgi:hypothetical protein